MLLIPLFLHKFHALSLCFLRCLVIFITKAHNNKFRAEILLVLLAIGNKILILLGEHVVVRQKFLLSSLLVIVNVGADVKTAEEHLKSRH